jgi:hypothetical protein
MATVLVENQLGSLTKRFRLPADLNSAKSFCNTALEGIYRIYAKSSQQGDMNDVSKAILSRILVLDRDTGKHYYIDCYLKDTVKSDDEIKKALAGWTGADDIIVLDFRPLIFGG